MCNCAARKKLGAIGCLVPELQSEMCSRCRTQLFEKPQCFYVATLNLMSLYTIVSRKFTRILVKKQLGSRQRQLGKTTIVKAEAYIVSMDRKTTIYGLEAGKIAFFEKRVQAGHSNAFPYFTGLPVSSSLYHSYRSRAGLHNLA